MKENSMFLTPATPDDIEVLIGNMKVNKGVSPNSFSIKILKDYKSKFSKPLSEHDQYFFYNRHIPQCP